MTARQGETVAVRLHLRLGPGYHVNSNTPSDEFLIPLKLSWDTSPMQPAGVAYPKGQMEKYSFSEKPLSVYTGDFELLAKFRVPANAAKGPQKLTGKVRYQACTRTMCLPPRSLAIQLPVEIR
ncbi:MAG: hypothetical protein JJE04_06705 [Acidobacteriia bacterium]|nr:hypothetical protein [Terriglobia bacterium]